MTAPTAALATVTRRALDTVRPLYARVALREAHPALVVTTQRDGT